MELILVAIGVLIVIALIRDYREKGQRVEQLTLALKKFQDRDRDEALDLHLRGSTRHQILLREKQYYENEYKKLAEGRAEVEEQLKKEISYKTMYENLYDMYVALDKEKQQLQDRCRDLEDLSGVTRVKAGSNKTDDEDVNKECREKLEIFNDLVRNKQRELSTREKELEAKTLKLETKVQNEMREASLVKKLCDEQIRAIPWMAELYSDYIEARTTAVGDYLLEKKNPAYKAADLVREVAKEQRKWAQAAKLYQYTTNYYESLIPWLTELLDFSVEEELPELNQPPSAEQDDPAKRWLSSDEYRKLPIVERNQLSLDRYLGRKKKTKREIGREYERYIGYCYEKDGYKVQYRGIIDGFEDLGRDLICTNSDHVVIVQCKCWSSDKIIREKHVNQLYGTGVMYAVENGLNGGQEGLFDPKHGKVRTRLITSTELSPVARKFADYLGVEYEENHKHGDYPVVKCNINRQTNERIYHLPFDQLYDRVDVEKERGEFFAWTVREAEDAGFRRAMRWHGNSKQET